MSYFLRSRWSLGAVLFLSVVGIASLVAASPASADLADDTSSWGVDGVDTSFGVRPNTSVASMESIGNLVFVGGKFTSVTNNGAFADDRSYLAAFDGTTGAYVPGFAAIVDGPVNAMIEYDGKLLIGGQFETVNGVRRTGVALLDPVTGALDNSMTLSVNGGNPANVRGFDISGGFLYLTGSFDRAVAQGISTTLGGVARYNMNTDLVDSTWLASINAANWGIAADPANGRVYVASFATGGLISLDINSGATVRSGFTGGSISKPYDVVVYRGKVWIAGAEHALFALDSSTLAVEQYHYSGRAGQAIPWNGGEYQAIEVIGDRIYASCHCNLETYLVGENIRRPVSFLVAFDANTGLHIPEFDPHLMGTAGPWAITEGPGGCVWTGGDLRKSGASQVDNIAQLCEVVDVDAAPLLDLAPTATVTRGSGWVEYDLGAVQSISSVQVRSNIGDNFIIVSNTPFRNDKTPAALVGMAGYTGTRVITSYAVNDRFFSTPGRYVRIYTTSGVVDSAVSIYGHNTGIDAERPSVPSGISSTTSGSDVDLAWTASTDNLGVAGYQVFRTDDLANPFTIVDTAAGTSYTDTGLADGDYWYYLKAIDAAGNTSWRTGYRAVTVNSVVVAPDAERPTIPTGVSSSVSVDTATLAWAASTDNVGVAGYQVFRTDDLANPFTIVDTAAGTTYTDTGLADGDYWYYLKAIDAAGNTSWRTGYRAVTINSAVVAPDTERPTTPRGLSSSLNGVDVTLTWTGSTDNVGVTSYNVYDTDGTVVATATTDSTVITGLTPGETYTFWIKAVDAAGNTSWRSNIVTVNP